MTELRIRPTKRLWVEECGKTVSPFGKKVHQILSHTFDGIYHISKAVLHDRVKWDSNHHIEVVIYGSLSTYDFDLLTRLVIVCHQSCVRLQIGAAAPNYLRLIFHPRLPGSGSMMKGHPTIEQAIKRSGYSFTNTGRGV